MAETDYTIRPAVRSDAPAAAAMWAQMADQHRAYDGECWNWTLGSPEVFGKHFAQLTSDPEAVVLVAVDAADRPIGYLIGQCRDAPPIFAAQRKGTVFDLFVEPAWREHGVGKRLMHSAEVELKQRGAQELDLQVATDNQQALRFYQALGMRRVAVRMFKRL